MQSPEILELIREHAERIDVETAPVRFDELRDPTERTLEPRAQRTTVLRGSLVAVAAAVVVLAVVGGGLVLLGILGADDGPVSDTVVTTVTAPVPTTTTPATTEASVTTAPPLPAGPSTTLLPQTTLPPSPPTSWTHIETEMTARDVTAGPRGLVALGSDGETVWHSDDGAEWMVAGSLAQSGVVSLAHGGPAYVAFGGWWDIDVRSSIDGLSWVPAEHVDDGTYQDLNGDPAPGTYGEINAIAYGAGHYVAVGAARDFVNDDGSVYYEYPRAAVWTSTDAMSWTRLPENDEVFSGPWHQEMIDVAFGPAGFVAVGYDEGSDPSSEEAAVWHSPNGTDWSRVLHDESLFGGPNEDESDFELWSVAAGEPGYVAVGRLDINGGAGVVVSADGLDWTRVPNAALQDAYDGDLSPRRVVYGEGFHVIMGWEFFDEPESGTRYRVVAIWHSPDLTTWTRVPHDDVTLGSPELVGGGGELYGAATSIDGHFVFVSSTTDETLAPQQPGHVWIGEPAS